MGNERTELLIYGIALKWHLKNLERRAFGFACLSAFFFGALLVENITLAYICREKAHNSAENAAYDSGNDSCASSDFDQAALKDKGGKSRYRSAAAGKHSNFIIGEPFNIANDVDIIGDVKPVEEFVHFNVHNN